jgi:hypothetical protein
LSGRGRFDGVQADCLVSHVVSQGITVSSPTKVDCAQPANVANQGVVTDPSLLDLDFIENPQQKFEISVAINDRSRRATSSSALTVSSGTIHQDLATWAVRS